MLAMVSGGVPEPGYRILRRGGGPDDVIVVGAAASAGTLAGAIHDLILVRRATGDTASAERSVRVRGGGRAPAAPPAAWISRVLADLQAATPRTLASLGRVRSVRIWLPAQHRERIDGDGMP